MPEDRTTRQNRVREALGRIYEQQPPYFREYLRRYQEDPTSRVFAPLAEAYRRLGRVDEAILICQEGLEHHPDFYGGRVALAKCYFDKKNFSLAKAELERVVNAVPENLLAQRLLGEVHLMQNNRREALHCYKMALLLSPSDIALAERVHSLENSSQRKAHERDASLWGNPEPLEEAEPTPEVSVEPSGDILAAEAPAAPENTEPVSDSTTLHFSNAVDLDADSLDSFTPPTPPADPEPPADIELPDTTEAEDTLPGVQSAVDNLLGVSDDDSFEEGFKVEHVSAIFSEEPPDTKREITTETLGDLYYSQGRFDRALRIYDKLDPNRTPEIRRKINACRAKLGVDHSTMVRVKQVELLKAVLKNVQDVNSRQIESTLEFPSPLRQ